MRNITGLDRSEKIAIVLVGGLMLFMGMTVLLFPKHSQGPCVNQYNYDRVTSGMSIVQVTEIVGEGEIHYLDKRMVVMKYTAEGVEIRVIFVEGVVYQKSLEQDGRVMNQDGKFMPEIEL
jgi:hypothetical protein